MPIKTSSSECPINANVHENTQTKQEELHGGGRTSRGKNVARIREMRSIMDNDGKRDHSIEMVEAIFTADCNVVLFSTNYKIFATEV